MPQAEGDRGESREQWRLKRRCIKYVGKSNITSVLEGSLGLKGG